MNLFKIYDKNEGFYVGCRHIPTELDYGEKDPEFFDKVGVDRFTWYYHGSSRNLEIHLASKEEL